MASVNEVTRPAQNQTTTISDLPDDLIKRIYKFLPVQDIVNGRIISKRFHQILEGQKFWAEILHRDIYLELDTDSSYETYVSIYRTEQNWKKGNYRYVEIEPDMGWIEKIVVKDNYALAFGPSGLKKINLLTGETEFTLFNHEATHYALCAIVENLFIEYRVSWGPCADVLVYDLHEGKELWSTDSIGQQVLNGNHILIWHSTNKTSLVAHDLYTGKPMGYINSNNSNKHNFKDGEPSLNTKNDTDSNNSKSKDYNSAGIADGLEGDSLRIDTNYLYCKGSKGVYKYDRVTYRFKEVLEDYPDSAVKEDLTQPFEIGQIGSIYSGFNGKLLQKDIEFRYVIHQEDYLILSDTKKIFRICDFSHNSKLPYKDNLKQTIIIDSFISFPQPIDEPKKPSYTRTYPITALVEKVAQRLQAWERMRQQRTRYLEEQTHYLPITHFDPLASSDPIRKLISEGFYEDKKSKYAESSELKKQLKYCGKNTYKYLEKPVLIRRGVPNQYQTGLDTTTRFENMRLARQLCKKHGLKHLLIPKARIYKHLHLEEALPVHFTNKKEVVGMYYTHKNKFDQAIHDLTVLFCYADIPELCFPEANYNIVALVFDDEVGKLGLIDLQNFKQATHPVSAKTQAIKLITFFPYHYDQIITILQKNIDPTLSKNDQELIQRRNEVIGSFRQTYINHLEFINAKGISLDHPNCELTLSDTDSLELNTRLAHLLKSITENDRDPAAEFFAGNKNDRDPAAEFFAGNKVDFVCTMFNPILNDMLKTLTECVHCQSTPMTLTELLMKRTVLIQNDNLKFREMIRNGLSSIPALCSDKRRLEGMTIDLEETILSFFAEKGIIQYHGTYGRNPFSMYENFQQYLYI